MARIQFQRRISARFSYFFMAGKEKEFTHFYREATGRRRKNSNWNKNK
jgi:hypothetical protein